MVNERKEYHRDYYLKNKEKILERNKIWAENNKHKIKKYSKKNYNHKKHYQKYRKYYLNYHRKKRKKND